MRLLYMDIDTLRPDHLGCYDCHRPLGNTWAGSWIVGGGDAAGRAAQTVASNNYTLVK